MLLGPTANYSVISIEQDDKRIEVHLKSTAHSEVIIDESLIVCLTGFCITQ